MAVLAENRKIIGAAINRATRHIFGKSNHAPFIAKYLDRNVAIESSYRFNAPADGSSGLGPFQFIEPTWLNLVGALKNDHPSLAKQYGFAGQRTNEQLLALRTDPRISSLVAVYSIKSEVLPRLKSCGVQPTPLNLYADHFLGGPRAVKLFRLAKNEENLNKPAAQFFPDAASAEGNHSLFYVKDNAPAKKPKPAGRPERGKPTKPLASRNAAAISKPHKGERLRTLGEFMAEMEKRIDPESYHTVFCQPTTTKEVSSHFGNRKHPITGEENKFHAGTDYPAPPGAPVRAVLNGTVLSVSHSDALGTKITIRHDNGMLTKSNHLAKPQVKAGQRVFKGQVIAEISPLINEVTGKELTRITGPHLHLEVQDAKGRLIDPNFHVSRSVAPEKLKGTRIASNPHNHKNEHIAAPQGRVLTVKAFQKELLKNDNKGVADLWAKTKAEAKNSGRNCTLTIDKKAHAARILVKGEKALIILPGTVEPARAVALLNQKLENIQKAGGPAQAFYALQPPAQKLQDLTAKTDQVLASMSALGITTEIRAVKIIVDPSVRHSAISQDGTRIRIPGKMGEMWTDFSRITTEAKSVYNNQLTPAERTRFGSAENFATQTLKEYARRQAENGKNEFSRFLNTDHTKQAMIKMNSPAIGSATAQYKSPGELSHHRPQLPSQKPTMDAVLREQAKRVHLSQGPHEAKSDMLKPGLSQLARIPAPQGQTPQLSPTPGA